MTEISVEKVIKKNPAVVWEYVSEWGGTERWIPGVGPVSTEGEGVGATRSAELSTDTGFPGSITERLDALDENSYWFRYSTIGENPLPVSNYTAEMKVEPFKGGSLVTWSSTWEVDGFSEEELKSAFEQLYRISLDNVERDLVSR